MNNSQEELQKNIQEMEITRDKATELVAMADALDRLKNLPDFKLLILGGYLEQECINLVHRKSQEAFKSENDQKLLDYDIRAIGSFMSYLHRTKEHGEMSRSAILSANEEISRAHDEVAQGA
jgi:hypothetical protein